MGAAGGGVSSIGTIPYAILTRNGKLIDPPERWHIQTRTFAYVQMIDGGVGVPAEDLRSREFRLTGLVAAPALYSVTVTLASADGTYSNTLNGIPYEAISSPDFCILGFSDMLATAEFLIYHKRTERLAGQQLSWGRMART